MIRLASNNPKIHGVQIETVKNGAPVKNIKHLYRDGGSRTFMMTSTGRILCTNGSLTGICLCGLGDAYCELYAKVLHAFEIITKEELDAHLKDCAAAVKVEGVRRDSENAIHYIERLGAHVGAKVLALTNQVLALAKKPPVAVDDPQAHLLGTPLDQLLHRSVRYKNEKTGRLRTGRILGVSKGYVRVVYGNAPSEVWLRNVVKVI